MKDGVLIAVEKRITSPLIDPSSIEKIIEIDSHIGELAVESCSVLMRPFIYSLWF